MDPDIKTLREMFTRLRTRPNDFESSRAAEYIMEAILYLEVRQRDKSKDRHTRHCTHCQ